MGVPGGNGKAVFGGQPPDLRFGNAALSQRALHAQLFYGLQPRPVRT